MLQVAGRGRQTPRCNARAAVSCPVSTCDVRGMFWRNQPQEGAEDDGAAGVEDLKKVLANGVKGKPYSRYVYVSPSHSLPLFPAEPPPLGRQTVDGWSYTHTVHLRVPCQLVGYSHGTYMRGPGPRPRPPFPFHCLSLTSRRPLLPFGCRLASAAASPLHTSLPSYE